jgi:hypothetical protein
MTRVAEVVGRGRFDGEEGVVEVLVNGDAAGFEREAEGVREGPRWERSRDVERMRVY